MGSTFGNSLMKVRGVCRSVTEWDKTVILDTVCGVDHLGTLPRHSARKAISLSSARDAATHKVKS